MSLNLDPRQRAMLREMGIRVWQPLQARRPLASTSPLMEAAADRPAPAQHAIDSVAPRSGIQRAEGKFDPENIAPQRLDAEAPRSEAPAAQPKTAAVRAVPAALSPAPAPSGEDRTPWGVGRTQLLYAPTGAESEPARAGARWLVLAEVDTEALQAAIAQPATLFNPFGADPGRLLDNMLRAARLHEALSVHLVPLARNVQAAPVSANVAAPAKDAQVEPLGSLATALPAWVNAVAPDVVLVMGRFAAQALLPTELPFGKLRGQVHTLCGRPAVVTYDAGCLLRNQADKAKAWDDLRLAMNVAAQAAR